MCEKVNGYSIYNVNQMLDKRIKIESGTFVVEKIKKDPRAFEKLMALRKRPMKISEEEYMKIIEAD